MTQRVLILAAHGSREDPQVNGALRELTRRVADRTRFDAVQVAFHQGEPSFADVMDVCPASSYVVVPVMTSGGYYATQVLPRELRRNRQFARARVRFTMPVGVHPALATQFIHRATRLLDQHRVALRDATVAVVGHGTRRHPDSRRATEAVAAQLARRLPVADVLTAFIDDEPGVDTLATRAQGSCVLVLPLLISAGPHTRVDVPRALGMPTPAVPLLAQPIAGRLWIYDQPLAEQPELADLVVDLAGGSAAAPTLRLGTRASRLAMFQAHLVADRLRTGGAAVELVAVSTHGDRDRLQPIEALPGDAPFVADLEDALLAGEIDVAVHSLKDMPLTPRGGVQVAAVLPRGRVSEALVARGGHRLADLPVGAVVGTSSTRRAAQLRHARSDLRTTILRGPVDRRLADLRAGRFDAIIVAAAALERLGRLDEASELLDERAFLPAPAQGAIAVQIRADDHVLAARLATLDDEPTRVATWIERRIAAAFASRNDGVVAAMATGYPPYEAAVHWLHLANAPIHQLSATHDDPDQLVRALVVQLEDALACEAGAVQ